MEQPLVKLMEKIIINLVISKRGVNKLLDPIVHIFVRSTNATSLLDLIMTNKRWTIGSNGMAGATVQNRNGSKVVEETTLELVVQHTVPGRELFFFNLFLEFLGVPSDLQ